MELVLSTSTGYKSLRTKWPSQELHHRVVSASGVFEDLGLAISNYCYIMAPGICRPIPEDHRKNLVQLVWLAELADWFSQNQNGEG